MKYLAPVPKQYVDESGIPYSGGTVFVYLHGTPELADIYSGATGEALMENPCTLDSNGSWQCFVPSGVPLDYIVKDADGNVVSSFIDVVIPEGSGGSSSDMEVVGTPNEILVDRRHQKFVVALSSTIKNSISYLADSITSMLSALGDKADKVTNAVNGNFAGLDSNGNLIDSGKNAADFATDAHLAAETARAQAAEAAAKTVVSAGENCSVTKTTASDGHDVYTVNADGKPQVQSDWNQSDSSKVDYIKNKPANLVQDANYVHTDNNYTNAEKTKLASIESGAQVNVIEKVKVNGAEQSITDKDVDISVPTASTATPLKDGTASAGSSTQWARGDHRHPTDDSREAVSNKKQVVNDSSTTEYPSSKAVADFVNSSVATNTANFLGTIAESSLGLDYTATNEQIALALNVHSWVSTPTNNDYCFVSVNDPQTTDVDEYRRFKFNGSVWAYEYTLNNSSFTQEQWDAINSGLTSSDRTTYNAAVTLLNTHVGDSSIHVTAADKTNWNSHVADTSNPHNVTKSQVGLGNVDNTSDLNKPISTAQQAALNTKQKVISIVTGAPIILDANGNMDLKISDGTFLDRLPYFEQIGDKQYKVCLMPDGKIWMCENLDYGSSGVYYNNDETTYGWNGLKYGKLYTWNEAVTAANAISGWHLPSADEWDALATAVGGSDVAATKLKSTTGWTYVNGTDDFGFAGFPAGRLDSGPFRNLGLDAYFWTATESSSTLAWYRNFSTGADVGSYRNDKTSYAISVRLVKD